MADEMSRIDRATLARLDRLGGPPLVTRMIELFLENAPERMGRATTGALEGDLAAIERATHSLKSMAANIGALELYALAESIEIDAAAGRSEKIADRVARLGRELDLVRAALADLKGDDA